jgi:hypothetical protein
MSFFGQDFLQGFKAGFFGAPGLKDYSHAAKTFRTNGYELTPRYKFLYHVFFNINTAQIPALKNAFGNDDIGVIGMMCKTVQLPNYSISVETMNQYNRKRLVQTKIDYDPVTIVFNDDQGDLIRNMWYNYYTYYYKDAANNYENTVATSGSIGRLQTLQNGFNYNTSDIYENSRQVSDWGYIGEGYADSIPGPALGASNKPPFFRDIKIYGLNQKKFASWVLINPMITNWQHDTFDYSQGSGIMTNTMSIKYETVKYYTGYVGGQQPSNTVVGFADPNHYDVYRSGISRPGSQATVFGQGGLVDAGIGVLEDLQALATGRGGLQNIIGGVQKGAVFQQIAQQPGGWTAVQRAGTAEWKIAQNQILQQSLPGAVRQVVNLGNGQIFPKAPPLNTGIGQRNTGQGVLGPNSRIGL